MKYDLVLLHAKKLVGTQAVLFTPTQQALTLETDF